MPLCVYNTLSRLKEPFLPLDPGHVRMYVCGPTVYDRAHIGNARPVVVFDVLYRLLRQLYPRVTYARNITDVDDKINARARERGCTIADLTLGTTRDFHADMDALNCLSPDIEPRATAHIAQMIKMIGLLIERGHAYEAEGHVLFSVASWSSYGKLSRRSLDEMIAGARVDVAPYKRDPVDFVLWKPSSGDLPGWDSPLGAWTARLAYRMLGHEPGISGAELRYPWRRPGFGLPPSRERDRAERGRLRPDFRPLLAA